METMSKYQKIVVTGFLQKDEKVLLVKRKKEEKFLPEYFEMLGGKRRIWNISYQRRNEIFN